MKNIKVALVGQPNVGKSMLINSISNSNLRVGNFSGVTVERAEVNFKYKDYNINVIDLPGTYSLSEYTIEERVTKGFLLDDEYDVILNVADSTNLDRNLSLTVELLELDKKLLLALNMSDEAKKERISINDKALSEILGINCVKVSASTKSGIDRLLEALIATYENQKRESKVLYSDLVEQEIFKIVEFLDEKKFNLDGFTNRKVAINALKEDKSFYQKISQEPIWLELSDMIKESLNKIYIKYDIKDLDEIFYEEHGAFINGAIKECVKRESSIKESLTERIDSILINKFLGIPIFLFLMWGLFQLTFELGSIPMDYIDAFFAGLGSLVGEHIAHEALNSLIVDGIIAGVGAVILFVPNIAILFLGIALLETTGYMARVAFLLDGFFHKFGLHGKSFIPLVTGFGCSVPAYMSARTLKNEKDRLITLFIIGFMSCGARLPVYVLFAGAFFDEAIAGNILFLIYIAGSLLGLVLAKILRVFAFKGEDEAFVMEMPKYRLPSFKLVSMTIWSKVMMYLKKAGTFILAATILIWFASNYPKNPELVSSYEQKIEIAVSEDDKSALNNELNEKLLESSYLGVIGKATEPLFAPLGFDWKLTVALETGLAAKEIAVATLGVLYSLGDEVDEADQSLMQTLRENLTIPIALSYIAFVMLYMPCLAASVVFTKEAGGYKYFVYLFLLTTIVAWIVSFITYNIAKLFY